MARNSFIPNWRGMYQFLKDPKTSWKPKALVVVGVLYLLWPADMLTDFIPFLGWLDDLGFSALVIWYLSRVTDKYIADSTKK